MKMYNQLRCGCGNEIYKSERFSDPIMCNYGESIKPYYFVRFNRRIESKTDHFVQRTNSLSHVVKSIASAGLSSN